jgi:hypothetical protein
MRQLNSEIINEKVKYQEQQRDKNNEVKKNKQIGCHSHIKTLSN